MPNKTRVLVGWNNTKKTRDIFVEVSTFDFVFFYTYMYMIFRLRSAAGTNNESKFIDEACNPAGARTLCCLYVRFAALSWARRDPATRVIYKIILYHYVFFQDVLRGHDVLSYVCVRYVAFIRKYTAYTL